MSNALTPPYMRKMLHFFNGGSPLDVLKHAIAIAVTDKPRKKFAIAQLVLHQPAGAHVGCETLFVRRGSANARPVTDLLSRRICASVRSSALPLRMSTIEK